MWRYILRAKTTWGFFVLMGVINPLVLLLLFGAERGMWYAISGFMAGLLGGFWMSRIIWKKCEDAFAGNSDADAIAQ